MNRQELLELMLESAAEAAADESKDYLRRKASVKNVFVLIVLVVVAFYIFKAYWSSYQAGMQKQFDYVSTLQAPPQDKLKAWKSFLSDYARNNPMADEDELLRARATDACWDIWQSEMQTDFNKIEVLKGKQSIQIEITTWQSFLKKYSENNPRSKNDEKLRRQADKYYWELSKYYWELRLVQMNTDFDRLKDLRGKESAKVEMANWQSFMKEYIKDNPYTDVDEKLRKQADEYYWELRIKQMQSEFDRLVALHEAPTPQMQAWQTFLKDYQTNDPYTDIDEKLRTEAGKAYWTAWQTQMQTVFDRLVASQDVPKSKMQAWQTFLKDYQTNNPYTNMDERLRMDADKAYWTAWQTQMQMAFDAAVASMGTPELKMQTWQSLLENYKPNNPYTDADNKLFIDADKNYWAIWQEQMQTAFDYANSLQSNLVLQQEAWALLLKHYEPKNPYTDVDDKIYVEATTREDKVRWAINLSQMQAQFNQIGILQGTAESQMKAWKSFLNDYKIDNPYTNTDDTLRIEASKSYWVIWQSQMQTAFDNITALQETQELKKRKWRSFLEKYKSDNPYTDVDDKLREDVSNTLNAVQPRPSEKTKKPTNTEPATSVL